MRKNKQQTVESKNKYYSQLDGAYVGNIENMYCIAVYLRLGVDVERNINRSNYWLKKAAEKGHKDAKYLLGITCFEQDMPLNGVMWLEQSSRGGNASASFELSKFYFEEEDYDNQIKYLQIAIMQGSYAAGLCLKEIENQVCAEELSEVA